MKIYGTEYLDDTTILFCSNFFPVGSTITGTSDVDYVVKEIKALQNGNSEVSVEEYISPERLSESIKHFKFLRAYNLTVNALI